MHFKLPDPLCASENGQKSRCPSETYGTIYGVDWSLSFGINSQNAVFAWKGDLSGLPPAEQHHWLSENVPSLHDMASDFFDGQIEAKFTEPPIGVEALNALARWNGAFAARYGSPLYAFRDIEQRLRDVRRYRRLIINREDDFINYVSELNEIINEGVDNASIRTILVANGVAVPAGSKGNKLLELVYTKVLGDTSNLIAPSFYLYDLRLWADHDMGDGKLHSTATNLGIVDPTDDLPPGNALTLM